MPERVILQPFMKKNKFLLKKISIISVLFLPLFVLAQTSIPNPIGYDSFPALINGIVSFIRNLALVVAPIIFLIAGFMYYFSGGNPDKAKDATNLIKWAVVGLVIILIANGITAVITNIMGVDGP